MKSSAVLAFLVLEVACSGPGPARPSTSERFIPQREIALAGRSLTSTEAKLVDANGFAILGEGPVASFHYGYTAVFHKHQPVYVTADSLLYAWHSSYDEILKELEYTYLLPEVVAMLDELREKLAGATTADPQARADLDVYLAVAHGLVKGKQSPAVAGGDPKLITAMFTQGQSAQGEAIELFGAARDFDFTMLKPRGHYTSSRELEAYFRAMSWLGRVEMRLAKKQDRQSPWKVDRRVLRATTLLASLVSEANRKRWQAIDATLAALVGPPDSMSLPGLAAAVAALRGDVERASDAEIVAAFEAPSAQRIRTQLALAGEQSISFVTLGQRFVFDSKVFSDLTYGSLTTTPPRLMPTPLDVGHAVFHNPAAKRLLATEVKTYGAPYEQALEAAHRKTAAPDPALWEGSLYHLWLDALRQLSPDPARDAGLPKPLTTDAWARRMLGTQLASWAELRHDNLLYAKQSVTAVLICAYPDGYIDPYPEFYARMEMIAKRGRAAIDGLAFNRRANPRLLAFFDGMSQTMARLRAIAVRERANQPLLAADLDFLNRMVSVNGRSTGCATTAEAEGWYADLYYVRSKILHHEPIIADVHTQPTNEAGIRIGRVLHVGTGYPHMMVATLQHDAGANKQTYRGFVSRYAETITQNFERLTDEDWRACVEKQVPAPPPWMTSIIAE